MKIEKYTIDVQSLFPVPLGTFNYKNDGGVGVTKQQVKYLDNTKLKINSGNYSSESSDILENELFFDIKNYILGCVNTYVEHVWKPSSKLDMYITQSWYNITKKDEYHHEHIHQNSLLSGVFYVNTSDEDKITFIRSDLPQFFPTSSDYNIWNSERWWFPVNNNDLLIFPSMLKHYVPLVKKGSRKTIAFNTFFKGEMGDKDSFAYLSL